MKPGPEADQLYIRHMLDCIERIERYTNADESRFKGSPLIQDAVMRNLQTLAESSQRLSEGLKCSAPEVPWRAIAGFRNVLVHGYLGADMEVVWQVVAKNLPLLRNALLRLRQDDGPQTP